MSRITELGALEDDQCKPTLLGIGKSKVGGVNVKSIHFGLLRVQNLTHKLYLCVPF